jgi:hypothetical protein
VQDSSLEGYWARFDANDRKKSASADVKFAAISRNTHTGLGEIGRDPRSTARHGRAAPPADAARRVDSTVRKLENARTNAAKSLKRD